MAAKADTKYLTQKKSTQQLIKDLIAANKEQGIEIDYSTMISNIRKKFGNTAESREVIALLQSA